MADAIESVGLGVDLLGGDTLAQLRAIRAEMEAIATLGSRSGSGGAGGYGGPRQATLRTQKEITDAEVENYANAQQRRAEIKSRSDALLITREKALQDEITRIEIRAAEERERALLRIRNSSSRTNSPVLATQINRSFPDEIPITTRTGVQVIRAPRPAVPIATRAVPVTDDAEFEALRQDARSRRAAAVASRTPEQSELVAYLENGGDPKKFVSKSELESAEGLRRQGLVDRARQKRSDNAYVKEQLGDEGGPGGPGGGGAGGRGGGFSSAASRLTRNFIIYEALSLVTRDLYQYVAASLEAAKATTEQANALVFATEAAHGNLEANRALAVQIQSVGFNQAEASGVVAAAARATYRHPDQTAALTQEAVNIAAFRGGGLKETPKVIEDIIGGRDRSYREYFNITPEEIYKEAARKKLGQESGQGFAGVGNKDYTTEAQRVSKYVATLTEEEKEQLRLNYVLTQSFRFQGDAIERAGTLAGKMDLVSAAFFNASANVGAFVADITPVKNLLDQIAGSANQASNFSPAVLRQSGPRSTISDSDVINYAGDSTTGTRAAVLKAISGIGSFIANNVTPVNTAAALNRKFSSNELDDSPTSQYARDIASNVARSKQVRQFDVLRQQGQTGYRSLDNTGELGKYFSYQELTNKGLDSGDILRHYVEELKPSLNDGTKGLEEYRKKRKELVDQIATGNGKFAQTQLNALDAQQNASILDAFTPTDYREEARKREDERKTKEAQQKERDEKIRDDRIRQEGFGLSKLRDAAAGSFKLIGDIGQSITGADNPFTRILADQITSAERMRQQWGFLGEAAVKYFDTLEQKALSRQLNAAEFGAYTQSTNLLGQAARESDQRNNPTTLSRRDQDYLNIQEAIVERAKQIPLLWRQAAEVLGRGISPTQELAGRLNLLTGAFGVNGPVVRNALGQDVTNYDNQRRNALGQPLGDFFDIQPRRNALGQSLENPSAGLAFANVGAGESPEVRRVLQKSFADSIVDTFKDFSPAQIRRSGYQDFYIGAIRAQGDVLTNNIQTARQKAEVGAREDVRLKQQLDQDSLFRAKQIAAGRDPRDVGRESDRLLLSRTEGIPSKDLTFDQFAARQEAQRREAERAVQDQAEAKAATQQALEYQKSMQSDIQAIRTAILSGSVKALIQVQNDTQARVDQDDLETANAGQYNPLDQRSVKSSAYTPSTEKYKRTGGQYGLTNR